ncbi:uncharacterized protein UV8b_06718 [Ustilaginoidea virens]|uniref:Uncharacterized protein n=1 Tax=Ustilaginoidea virens TaxID=1159556 RepID=A0A8E5MKA6_USTVR|nr:uncharacterized protein UV8b_06718 [Ustilaginoidea virens]QUC22477.1 hypothetical protein UV8b_06718 [Ustilaginoidea virens]
MSAFLGQPFRSVISEEHASFKPPGTNLPDDVQSVTTSDKIWLLPPGRLMGQRDPVFVAEFSPPASTTKRVSFGARTRGPQKNST